MTTKLEEMCAIDLWPLGFVAKDGFKAFVHALNPQYQVSTRSSISKQLETVYCDVKK